MKISIKRMIVFLLLFALLVLMFIFNRRRVVLFFLVAMVLYLVSAVLLFLPSFPLPEITLGMSPPTQQTRESGTFLCRLKYEKYYPFSRVRILYGLRHSMEEEYSYLENSYNIFHGVKEYSLDITFQYCGVYEIKCQQAQIFDLLGLFSKKIEHITPVHAVVLPQDTGLKFHAARLVHDDEEDIYSDPYAGSDVSEIKELREYREGDRLSQIHWKLSTKSEELIVKEYAKHAGVCIAVACDGSYSSPAELTAYYELLYAFGRSLINEETFFELVYYNSFEEDTISRRVDNLYDLSLMIQEMFFHLKPVDTAELVACCSRNGSKLRLLYLTMNEPGADYKILLSANNARVITERQ